MVVPSDLERDAFQELLDPGHRVPVVGVRLVPLEHRELRVVLERDALVAKVLPDLVHALEAAHDQALEVELGRDAQVEVRVELVVVGRERPREGAAVARLQDRRLDLDEPPLVERAPDRRDDLRAGDERLAGLLVHQEVEVPPAVAQLDVREAVEGVRQRLGVAGEDLDALGEHGGLPAPRLRRTSGDADHVTEVEVDLARDGDVADHLDAARAVDEVEEHELAHPPPRHRAPGEPPGRSELAPGLERLGLGPDRRDLVPVGEALRRRLLGHRRIVRRSVGLRVRRRGCPGDGSA